MTHYAAYPEDELLRQPVRRPARRASASAWLLRGTTLCLGIAGLLLLGNLVVGWADNMGQLSGRTTDTAPVTLFIGKQRLVVPTNMFRFDNQRATGTHDRVELAVHWPEMSGYQPGFRDDFADMGPDAPIVYLTIRQRDTLTDSAGRLVNVYQHFFEQGTIPAPAGLIGHRMSEESGLAGEEVYFEAGSVEPFATHCTASDGTGFPVFCQTEIHAGDDLSVLIRFRKGLLPNWAGIKSGVRVLLLSFGVTA